MSNDAQFQTHPGSFCGKRWRAVDVVVMVAGFALYWPLGLAVIGLKIYQKKTGQSGDFVDALRSLWQEVQGSLQGKCPSMVGVFKSSAANNSKGFAFRSSGNSAFDDWRAAELQRLEEERQKIVRSERDFSDHIEHLRRARDREEFEGFMARRG